MYDVLDVSRYIINYCNKNNKNISNLKLQKILYFVQAYFIIVKNEPCFKEDIKAWKKGPVVLESYHEFKCYVSGHIPKIDNYISIITEEDKKLIRKVIDKFILLSSSRLVEITQKQSPWLEARRKNIDIISIESIKNYFNEPNEEERKMSYQ